MVPNPLSLPLEIRNQIYKHLRPPNRPSWFYLWANGHIKGRASFTAALAVNKQMCAELTDVFNDEITFDLSLTWDRVALGDSLVDL